MLVRSTVKIVSVILGDQILNFWIKKYDKVKIKEKKSLGVLIICKQEIRKILHEKESLLIFQWL